MYRDIPSELLAAIEPVVHDHGLELVDAALDGAGSGARLRVVLDTPQGDGLVKLDDCAAVSRELAHALDALDLVAGSYTLEVTSPGIDRTLGREVDFERAVGQRVALETREPQDGRRRFKGELLDFEGAQAHLVTDSGDVRIPFDRIARARTVAADNVASRGRGQGGEPHGA
jgi:ribosome maturation factor RimP